jgi:glycosyltransferase involved in cell wall biosynthesis
VGFFKERKDLGHWASSCHMLVNPRPAEYGNDNNFPSKIFDYIQLGRPILSSVTPTLQHAFGESLMWYDADKPNALSEVLERVSQIKISLLIQDGINLRDKYAKRFSWKEQIGNLKEWMRQIR